MQNTTQIFFLLKISIYQILPSTADFRLLTSSRQATGSTKSVSECEC